MAGNKLAKRIFGDSENTQKDNKVEDVPFWNTH